jgi:hypothetical protein
MKITEMYEGSSYYSKSELCGGAVASDVLLTMFHPLLKSMLQTVDHFKISCFAFPNPEITWDKI